MGDAITYESSIEFVVRGHHVYKAIWNPVIGEELVCGQKTDNDEDSYAVAVKIEDTIVGHIPQELRHRHMQIIRQPTVASTLHKHFSRGECQGLDNIRIQVLQTLPQPGDNQEITDQQAET